jgi:hypothetical protein
MCEVADRHKIDSPRLDEWKNRWLIFEKKDEKLGDYIYGNISLVKVGVFF